MDISVQFFAKSQDARSKITSPHTRTPSAWVNMFGSFTSKDHKLHHKISHVGLNSKHPQNKNRLYNRWMYASKESKRKNLLVVFSSSRVISWARSSAAFFAASACLFSDRACAAAEMEASSSLSKVSTLRSRTCISQNFFNDQETYLLKKVNL